MFSVLSIFSIFTLFGILSILSMLFSIFSVTFHENYFVVSISQVQQRIGYCPQVS